MRILALVLAVLGQSVHAAPLSLENRAELRAWVADICRDADADVARRIEFEASGGAKGVMRLVGIDLSATATLEQFENIEQFFGEFRTNPTICQQEAIELLLPIFGVGEQESRLLDALPALVSDAVTSALAAKPSPDGSGNPSLSPANTLRAFFGTRLDDFVLAAPELPRRIVTSDTPPLTGDITVASHGAYLDDSQNPFRVVSASFGFLDGRARLLRTDHDCTNRPETVFGAGDACSVETCSGLEQSLRNLAVVVTNAPFRFSEVNDPGVSPKSYTSETGYEVAEYKWVYDWEADYSTENFAVVARFRARFVWDADKSIADATYRYCTGFVEVIQLEA